MNAIRIEQPYRRSRIATIEVGADADAVFAMMCPVREYEWEPGWATNVIISKSGRCERDCVFTTPAGASEGSTSASAEAIWTTPNYDGQNRRLTMIKVTPGECVTRLDIAVDPVRVGCAARVAYQHTALSPAGRTVVDGHTAEAFAALMQRWKEALERNLC